MYEFQNFKNLLISGKRKINKVMKKIAFLITVLALSSCIGKFKYSSPSGQQFEGEYGTIIEVEQTKK